MSNQLPAYPGNMFGFYHQCTTNGVMKAKKTVKGTQIKADTKRKQDVADALKRRSVPKPIIDEFLAYWSASQFPIVNNFLSSLTTLDSAVKVGRFFYQMKLWGYSGEHAARVLVFVAGLKSADALKIIELSMQHGPRLGKVLKSAGDIGTGISIFMAAVQCYLLIQQGEYSQVAAVIYKTVIGTAVAWGGAIDALQSVLEMFVPDYVQKNSTVFKVIRAVDPVGLGGIGVDTMVFFVQAAIDALRGKQFDDRRMTELVKRMKTGPTRIFAEIGEEAGDALYDILQMDSQDWRLVATYSWQELVGVFKKRDL